MSIKHASKHVFNICKTTCVYVIWALTLPPLFSICFLLALLPASIRYDNRLYFVITTLISRIIMHTTAIKFVIHGANNIAPYPNHPAILVMNHSSALDIPIAEIVAGSYPHVWISKKSYQKIPIFGFLLKRMHVMVDTASRRDSHATLIRLLNILKKGPRHALVFPEGTRHSDGKIHTFLPGFALLAKKLQRPVIPIVISGMHRIFPKKSILIDSFGSRITITIGNPIYYPNDMHPDEFVAHVQHYFETEMHKQMGRV